MLERIAHSTMATTMAALALVAAHRAATQFNRVNRAKRAPGFDLRIEAWAGFEPGRTSRMHYIPRRPACKRAAVFTSDTEYFCQAA